jgi:hypothetical protein
MRFAPQQGGGPPPAAGGAAGGGGAGGTAQDPAALLAQAQAAIARGAPRDAVIARLRQMGIDPAGL